MPVSETIRTLEDAGASMRCADLKKANMTAPERYNINLRRVSIDGEMLYEARVREFPDATEYAETAQEAYELALDTVEASLEILQDQGKAPPTPSETPEDYSGRLTLRVPKTLHRRLTCEAELENISLNQYLVSLLAYHAGTRFGRDDSGQATPQGPGQDDAETITSSGDLVRELRDNARY